MARNQFGTICDICGYYDEHHNRFYRLILPTLNCELNNSTQYLDYCFKCYKDLKITLAKHYKVKWVEETNAE